MNGQLTFQHRNLVAHAVKERHDHINPRPQNRAQTAKPFHHIFFRLRHNPNGLEQRNNYQRCEHQQNNISAQQLVKKFLDIQ